MHNNAVMTYSMYPNRPPPVPKHTPKGDFQSKNRNHTNAQKKINHLKSFGRVATPNTCGYIDNSRKNVVFSSVDSPGEVPVEMKGLGCSDTLVKYRMPIPNMECTYCDKPNLFNCHAIHGRLTKECLEIAQRLLEASRCD